MALAAENRRYTFADVLTWPESDRIEIIDGEAFMMSPPSREHQRVLTELVRQFANYLDGKRCEVYPAPFGVRLLEEAGDTPDDVDTMVEPDITVVCDPGKLDQHGCKGAPDLIIEILSPSTTRHDRVIKFNLYQRAGVREYWIVDPADKIVHSFVLDSGRYMAKVSNGEEPVKVHVLDGCTIDFGRVFAERADAE